MYLEGTKQMPLEVAKLRQVAYAEIMGLADALDLEVYLVEIPLTEAGAGHGLGFMLSDYQKLKKQLEPLLDKRYFYLADAYSEAEYPYPNLRLLVNGSVMHNQESAEYAMHQGVYINLFLMAQTAFLSSVQERSYCQTQERIINILEQAQVQGELIDEASWDKLLKKRDSLMLMDAEASSKTKYFQIFPYRSQNYKQLKIAAKDLKKADRAPIEDDTADWSSYEFDVPEDLLMNFEINVAEEALG